MKRRIILLGVAVAGLVVVVAVAYRFFAVSPAGPEFDITAMLASRPASARFTYVGKGRVTVFRYLINSRERETGCDSSVPRATPAPDAVPNDDIPLGKLCRS
jgi:hypothetical protein